LSDLEQLSISADTRPTNQAGDIADSAVAAQRAGPPTFWIVRATLPGQTKASLTAFDDPEDAAAHVTWLVPRAVGKIKTYECTRDE
jgi:hypothetical protein